MRLTIAAIGKLSASSPEHSLITDYRKRLPWKLDIHELNVKSTLPEAQLKAKETELLLSAVPKQAKIVALDERGKALSSRDFAMVLKQWQESGSRDIAFLIGGAAGHDPSLYAKADLLLSFGAMTWPHRLVRPMLVEQLYRACTIVSCHPYHKE